jgi:hypothetical protein
MFCLMQDHSLLIPVSIEQTVCSNPGEERRLFAIIYFQVRPSRIRRAGACSAVLGQADLRRADADRRAAGYADVSGVNGSHRIRGR